MSAATGAVCTVTAPDPDTEIEGWTASASTSPGFRTVSVTVMISLGKAPGGKERTASRTTALKRMTVHRSGPSEIGPPPVESVADEDDASVAVPASVPWTVQRNVRVAPAGMSWGSGALSTDTIAGAERASNCTPTASDPPSLSTSAEISNAGPAGWLWGARSAVAVRWAGVTTTIDTCPCAATALPSIGSIPATGSVSVSRPAALAVKCQVKLCEAPAAMSIVSGGAWTETTGPDALTGPAATPNAGTAPEFDTVTVTAMSAPTSARDGAATVATNAAGVESTAWYTPCAAPLPNGPRTVSPYIPAVTPAGTTAASVWESIQRTSRSSTWPSEALKSASSARCDPALRCCTTEGSKPSPCSRTGVSRLTYPAAGSTEAGEGGEG